LDPIHVNSTKFIINDQYKNFPKGLNDKPLKLLVCTKGNTAKTKILNTNAITPPSLLGIALNIAYANKKYHSGIICTGVTKGLALI